MMPAMWDCRCEIHGVTLLAFGSPSRGETGSANPVTSDAVGASSGEDEARRCGALSVVEDRGNEGSVVRLGWRRWPRRAAAYCPIWVARLIS